MLRTLSAAAAASLAAFGAAQAATVTFSSTPTDDVANILATSVSGEVAQNVSGSIANVRLSPWERTTDPSGLYTSVNGAATYALGSDRTSISFVWGSPDSYNSVQFYDNGLLVDTATYDASGQNLANQLATINGVSGGFFDTVVFVSGGAAFEYANLSAVPVPAGGLLLLTALGAAAWAGRRKPA